MISKMLPIQDENTMVVDITALPLKCSLPLKLLWAAMHRYLATPREREMKILGPAGNMHRYNGGMIASMDLDSVFLLQRSFIPRPFPPPVFDCLQYANTEGEAQEIWSLAVTSGRQTEGRQMGGGARQ